MPAKPKGLFGDLMSEVIDPPEPLLVTDDIYVRHLTRAEVVAYQSAVDPDEKMRIIYREHKEAVEALFADLPIQVWYEFHDKVLEHLFGRGATRVEGK